MAILLQLKFEYWNDVSLKHKYDIAGIQHQHQHSNQQCGHHRGRWSPLFYQKQGNLHLKKYSWIGKMLILHFISIISVFLLIWILTCRFLILKGVFAKNERGYKLTAKNKRFWSLLILLLAVASIRKKFLKTTFTEERSVHTNSENCNCQHSTRIVKKSI